jgi:hypothetical protein
MFIKTLNQNGLGFTKYTVINVAYIQFGQPYVYAASPLGVGLRNATFTLSVPNLLCHGGGVLADAVP